MDFSPVLYWSFLILGVLTIVAGLRRWRQAGRSQVFVGLLLLTQVAAHSPVTWLRVPGEVIMALTTLWVIVGMFSWRKRGELWFSLVFTVFALTIAIVELLFDDLKWWQASLSIAFAGLLLSLLATHIYRLRTMKKPIPAVVS